jgi:hypothetical protein
MAQSRRPDSPDNLSDNKTIGEARLVKVILKNPCNGNTTEINAKVSLHLNLPLIDNTFAQNIGLKSQPSQHSEARDILCTYKIESKYSVLARCEDAEDQKWLRVSFFGTNDIDQYVALLSFKINDKWDLVRLASCFQAESTSPEPPGSTGEEVTDPVTMSERS